MFVTILDTCVDKSPPRKGLASMVIHFLLLVGMTVFLNNESLRGLLRGFTGSHKFPCCLEEHKFPKCDWILLLSRKVLSLLISERL